LSSLRDRYFPILNYVKYFVSPHNLYTVVCLDCGIETANIYEALDISRGKAYYIQTRRYFNIFLIRFMLSLHDIFIHLIPFRSSASLQFMFLGTGFYRLIINF
jgi:hypothetical protein